MALSSLVKNLSERLNYVKDFAFNYRKTHILGSLRYLDEALEANAKAPFFIRPNKGDILVLPTPVDDHSYKRENVFHEEALWLHYVATNWKTDLGRMSAMEAKDYQEAVAKLSQYNDLCEFRKQIRAFVMQVVRVTSIRRYVFGKTLVSFT